MSKEDWEIEWKDYYQILGVKREATQEEIHKAYLFYSEKVHPDKVKDSQKERATEEFKKFQEAYRNLKDKRGLYNSEWDNRNQSKADTSGQSANIKPKPFVDPPYIYISDAEAGEIRKTSFVIRNEGGPFKGQIDVNSLNPWITIVDRYHLDPNDKLPYKVDIEAQGNEWGRTYLGNIVVTLDNEVIPVQVELRTKPEPIAPIRSPQSKPVGRRNAPFSPMQGKWYVRIIAPIMILALIYFLGSFNFSNPSLFPRPVVALTGTEDYTTDAGEYTRYMLSVSNWKEYTSELFKASPDLPPCGLNGESSRTWVEIYDITGSRIYGFCSLSSPSSLQDLWFAVKKGRTPPEGVYIVLEDRKYNKEYISNQVAIKYEG